ncbi:hypothetical protein EJ05DRAFT_497604 [Pseudovirgaria hyperparasitica]|uniref:Uncharacterized protein n=1 Tax=Pseudovirgaria hyperparasitica TaxID=470096 RepID=A0A6A6WHB0_9PEZI|nr:uncharacterized protein EJ05DRAFT_497604 [Pseudovirgaria hyperparasitica]KAF2761037.1 hypothetical protein EJ05DRAFT_497604 [Pseudovirgaria hyperparasitica]
MKFLATLFFAAGVASSSLVTRDVDTIKNSILNITDYTQQLTDALISYNSTDQLLSLNQASVNAIDAVNSSIANCQDTSLLTTFTESLALAEPTVNLGDVVGKSIDTIISRKNFFDMSSLSPIIAMSLQTQYQLAVQFSNLVATKVPADTKEVAIALSQPIVSNIKRGLDAYGVQPTGTAAAGLATPTNAAPGPARTAMIGYGAAAVAAMMVAL